MKNLKRLNTLFLIMIVLLVLIDIMFANILSGIWDDILIAFLAISLLLSVIIELIIKRQKKKIS